MRSPAIRSGWAWPGCMIKTPATTPAVNSNNPRIKGLPGRACRTSAQVDHATYDMSVARTFEIAVPPKALDYPPMCANCGTATSESLDVAKVFRRVSSGPDANPDTFVVEHAVAPF